MMNGKFKGNQKEVLLFSKDGHYYFLCKKDISSLYRFDTDDKFVLSVCCGIKVYEIIYSNLVEREIDYKWFHGCLSDYYEENK